MPRVDAHQHFWDPATAVYPWMSDAIAPLCRRFGPEHLEPLLGDTGTDGTVLVQTRSSLQETEEFMRTAASHDFIVGVVGWVDLTDAAVHDTLAGLRARPDGDVLVAIRHQVEDEPDPQWLLRSDVSRGLDAVGNAGLPYELLVRPRDLPAAIQVVHEHPEVRFIVDHIAKPPIKTGEMEPWASLLRQLAAEPNTWCKLSGILTVADHAAWRVSDLVPYVAAVVEMFGIERLMYGSDWPVCLLAAPYETTLDATVQALGSLSASDSAAIFGENALAVYGRPNWSSPKFGRPQAVAP